MEVRWKTVSPLISQVFSHQRFSRPASGARLKWGWTTTLNQESNIDVRDAIFREFDHEKKKRKEMSRNLLMPHHPGNNAVNHDYPGESNGKVAVCYRGERNLRLCGSDNTAARLQYRTGRHADLSDRTPDTPKHARRRGNHHRYEFRNLVHHLPSFR